jgi:hypothetical protein
MIVRYTTENARMVFEFDGATHKDCLVKLAAIQELFEEPACGACKSKRIRFNVREFEGNTYYKMICQECSAQLDYGQHKVGGTLFVKRWDKDTRTALPNNGWYIYQSR